MKNIFVFFLFMMLLSGCAGSSVSKIQPSAIPEKRVTKTAIAPSAKASGPLQILSDDPWERCGSVQNSESLPLRIADISNEEYRRRVQITFMVQDSEAGSTFVAERCMLGKVYNCLINGRNNCAQKLDFSTEPNEAMQDFCADPEMEGSIVSPVISGINSAYEWRCHEGTALITAQIAEADLNGYDKSIWVEIPAP